MNKEKELTQKMLRLFGEDLKFTKGALHCHTQNSIDDGFATEMDVCKVAATLGAEAAIISDHGTAMGWDDFDDAAKKVSEQTTKQIKAIFGIEAYYLDDVTNAYSHLVLYAKNNAGLKQLQKMLSRSKVVDAKFGGDILEICCLTDETLEMLRGGNIIATSACINGVFGSIVLHNEKLNNKIHKHQAYIEKMAPAQKAYDEAKTAYEQSVHDLSVINAEWSEAKKAKKQSFAGKQKRLESMQKKLDKAVMAFDKFLEDGSAASEKSVKTALNQMEIIVDCVDDFQDAIDTAKQRFAEQKNRLASEMQECQMRASNCDVLAKKAADAKEMKAKYKAYFDNISKDIAKIDNRKEKIAELEEMKLSKKQSQELFQKRLKQMMNIFGENFYMEVQNHGLEMEKTIYQWLVKVAHKNKIPLIAANDAHMAYGNQNDIDGRQIRMSCRFKKWNEEREDATEYYIKNDRELAEALFQIMSEKDVIEAMTNVSKVIDMCNATIQKESHPPKAIDMESPKAFLEQTARAAIAHKYNQWTTEQEDRLVYELGIIDSMGFNDYFCVVYDIIDIGRRVGGLSYQRLDELKSTMNDMTMDELLSYIDCFNTEPNLSVGLGRGSGAGSLVCYLLGITNIDPFKYDLLFERFLNPERISMPDIDTDFRCDIKDVLLVYLKKKYGDRAIAQILTKSYLHGKSAIDKVVMILGDRDGCDYRYIADKLKKKNGVDFTKSLLENKDSLMANADSDIEKEIVEKSIIMDNNLDHTGLHAAGVVISDNADLAEYIPVAWDTGFQTWKTQCDMIQCEGKHGLLKIDMLLLKTLDIVTYTLRLIKQTHPHVEIDIENLPMEREVFEKIYATGDTKSVFQFESGGMVKFLRQLKPTCMEDIIAANAMYRPGPMDSATRFGV